MPGRRELYGLYDRADGYDARLERVVLEGLHKITDADLNAIKCLREERARNYELLRTVLRMRAAQKELARYDAAGVRSGPGYETARQRAGQLAETVDRALQSEGVSDESPEGSNPAGRGAGNPRQR